MTLKYYTCTEVYIQLSPSTKITMLEGMAQPNVIKSMYCIALVFHI